MRQPPPVEVALDKTFKLGGQTSSAGLYVAKHGVDKGLSVVQEMNESRIGVVVVLVNYLTGSVLTLWAGMYTSWEISMYSFCNQNTTDTVCCPSGNPANIVCTDPMSFSSNFSNFLIATYIIPLGSLLILFQLSATRTEPTTSGCRSKLACGREWLRAELMMYFGFIFFVKRRANYLLFLGILCLSISPASEDGTRSLSLAPLIGGGLALTNGLLHVAVMLKHPQFDIKMQVAVSAADARRQDE